MRASVTKHAQRARHMNATGAGSGTSALQRMADQSPVVQRLAALQAASEGSSSPVAQLQKIGPGGAGYQSRGCGFDFKKNHLGRNKADAIRKTLNRGDGGAYGMDNTVLLHGQGEIVNKVKNAEMDACTWLAKAGASDQYKVPISSKFVTLSARVGGSGGRQIVDDEVQEQTGTVNLKVYFDERVGTFKVTGVHSTR